MEQIVNTNVHVHIGLPEMCNLKEFARVYSKFKNNLEQVPIPITMVCTLLDSIEEVTSHISNFFSLRTYLYVLISLMAS